MVESSKFFNLEEILNAGTARAFVSFKIKEFVESIRDLNNWKFLSMLVKIDFPMQIKELVARKFIVSAYRRVFK